MSDTIKGPIELSGYDTLTLINPHVAVLPSGETIELPAGTKLISHGPKGGKDIAYEGKAAKAHGPPVPLS